ncbi:hypothetical protein GCM10023172_41300 [Hymenobacter ginsengisoli]|uniref:Glycerophosphoryl diester phosphodiesterase membrane domain-containing protein n=1 Tax=Hymenobacter ginsengisoli TaxID=1051626 RepID=A0ABP8QSS1_9BACT|nr:MULTISPECIES: hypothetical protein [unclassified Hymenobacter]MBO2032226.1 hypothetical protein [Hymenobacter sp. BT559]
MKNTFTTPADFWQERDFGAKISAVFEFIGAHWRALGKCLVYFVLPGALLMGIGLGMFTNKLYDFTGRATAAQRAGTQLPHMNSPFEFFNFAGLALAMVGGLLAFLLLSGTLYGYVRARMYSPADEPITPARVWAELRARLGRMVGGTLLLGLLGGVGFGVVFGVLMAFGSTLGRGSFAGPVLAVLLGYTLIGYISVSLALYYPVLWLEDNDVFASIGRCFQLIKGKWWATCGLLFTAVFLQSMFTIVFAIPQYAVMMGKMLQLPGLNSDVLGLAAQCLYAVGIIFTYCIPLLALVFQYLNLVERQEGVGLRLLVDQLGQGHTPAAESGHYRPDELGEY